MGKKKQLSVEQHKQLAIELQELTDRTGRVFIELTNNLPKRHPTVKYAHKLIGQFKELRLMLDKVHREHHGIDGPYYIRQDEPR